jgi:hypothetical protein
MTVGLSCSRSDGSDPLLLCASPAPSGRESSTVQNLSADPTAICAPPELWRFLPRLGRIPSFSKASTFASFFSLRTLDFELRRARMKTLVPPELLSFFESLKDSSTPAPLQSIHMHTKVLSTLSFPVASTSKETCSSFLSPSDGEFGCPPGSPSTQATSC